MQLFKISYILDEGDRTKKDKKEAAHYYKLSVDQCNVKTILKYACMLDDECYWNKKETIWYYKLA